MHGIHLERLIFLENNFLFAVLLCYMFASFRFFIEHANNVLLFVMLLMHILYYGFVYYIKSFNKARNLFTNSFPLFFSI